MSRANEHSVCSLAKRYLRCNGGWVTNKELSLHLSIPIGRISASMVPAVRDGSVQRATRGKKSLLMWRLTPVAPHGVLKFSIDWPPGFISKFDSVHIVRAGDRG